MKKLLLLNLSALLFNSSFGQNCDNAGFENGTLSGWTATWGDGVCVDSLMGLCVTTAPNPFEYIGLNQGTDNQFSNAVPEKNHFIMTTGYDPIVGSTYLPVVYQQGGNYSMRLGNAQAEDGGESISYSFTVDNTNSTFIYHFALVIADGGHSPETQPYFRVTFFDGNNDTIVEAGNYIDPVIATNSGNFINNGNYLYNEWTTESVSLENYIGQNVRVEFVTSDCSANGGSHFAYAYIDAECTNTVGVELNNNISVNIYPNPTEDIISVETSSSATHFQLHDVTGKLFTEGLVNIQKFNIDIRSLKSGIYFLSLQSNEGLEVKKIIIK